MAVLAVFLTYWQSRPAIRTVVVMSHAPVTDPTLDGLRHGLAALGWHEDESIHFVYPVPQPDAEALRAQARDLINEHTALVVALSTPAALAIREIATPLNVPILLVPSSDPVGTGLVSSTAHPGQAITGIAVALQEPRRLEMLKRLAPGVRNIWVPFNSTDPAPSATFARLETTAAKLGLTLVVADIRTPSQLHQAIDPLPRDIDAIFMPHDAMLASNTRTIVAAASARGLPASTPHREGVAQGALFSYGFNLYAVGRQAARLADQILSGTSATDLPIETAELDMTVNLAVADYLSLSIPEDMLRHARIVGRAGE